MELSLNNNYNNTLPSINTTQKKQNEEINFENINNSKTEDSSLKNDKEVIKNNNSKIEYNIANVGFSYDSEAKEFIVKVERNNKIVQYPSEYLLKLRKYILNQENHISI